MKKEIMLWILITLLAINIAYSVSDTVKDSTLDQLQKEEDKREYILEVVDRVNKISESKAVETMTDDLKRELNTKLALTIGNAENTEFNTLMNQINRLEKEYGIKYRTEMLTKKNMGIGAIAAIILLFVYKGVRKKIKQLGWIANKRLPSVFRSEKTRVSDIKELLEKKEPIIKENGEISRQLAGEIEFFKELVGVLKKAKHFQDFKNWGILFDMKSLKKGETDIIKDLLTRSKPKITVNGKPFEGLEIYNMLENLNQKGVAAKRLEENHKKLTKINKEIADITKSLMKFENKYDKACKALEINLEREETEMQNFYKRFIVWEKREVLVNVGETKTKIEEHLKKLGAEKDEGMKKFAEEAKKMIQAYHYKQQLVNAVEGKIKADTGKGVREFGGEAENIEINNKILEKIPHKLGEGRYDELRKDMAELILNSNNIAGLYTRWEKIIIKALVDELKIQEEFDKLSMERVKDIGGMKTTVRDITKKIPGVLGGEKEMDKIANDVIKYIKTLGESKAGKLRDQQDIERKAQAIIEEEIKKSKKATGKNLDYLRDKINTFIKTEGQKMFIENALFIRKEAEARKFSETLSLLVTRKIEEIKGGLKK